MEEKAFEQEILSKRVGELLKEHDIKYDRENLLPTDKSLLKDAWEAGYTLALEAGMYCTDTKRRILMSEDEIKEGLKTVVEPARGIEGKNPMMLGGGPAGIPTPEKIFVPLHVSFAQEPGVSTFYTAVLSTFKGMNVKMGTPLEILGPRYEAIYAKEALAKAGKTDIFIVPSGAATYGSFSGLADKDVLIPVIPFQPELKTNLKVITMYSIVDDLELAAGPGNIDIVGSYAGPDGTLLMGIAVIILLYTVFGGATMGCGTVFNDMRWGISTSRECFWPWSVYAQTLNKQGILAGEVIVPRGPTSTDMVLKENVAATIVSLASGASSSGGSCSGSAVGPASGLDYRIIHETNQGMAGVTRKQANDLVKTILDMYEERLQNPPKGKNFEECYNLKTVKPSKDWLNLYNKTKKELEDIGVKFKEAE